MSQSWQAIAGRLVLGERAAGEHAARGRCRPRTPWRPRRSRRPRPTRRPPPPAAPRARAAPGGRRRSSPPAASRGSARWMRTTLSATSPLGLRVPGEIDVADRAAAEEVAKLEAAHLLRGQHHRPGCLGGRPDRAAGGPALARGRRRRGLVPRRRSSRRRSPRRAPGEARQHAAAAVAHEAVLDQLRPRSVPHLDAGVRGRARRPAVAGDQVGLQARGAALASTSTPPPGLSWR